MKRNLKALGLALAATFAMSAVAASGASAQIQDHFRSDGPLTHLTAEALTPQVFQVTTGDDTEVICNEVDVHGTIAEEEVTKVTVEPTYDDCDVWDVPTGENPAAHATVDTNGCHFEFTSLTDAEGHAETTIQCPKGEPGITITVTGFNVPCVHVEGGQEVNGVSYHNGEVGSVRDITLKATVHGIKSTRTHNAFVCPTPSGKTETHTGGTYNGEVTVTGFEDSAHEVPTDIWVESTIG